MSGYLVGCCRSVRIPPSSSSGWRHSDWSRFVLVRLHQNRQFSSTTLGKNEEEKAWEENQNSLKSKRQQFKETPVHPSIRRYIEMIGVGIPDRRKGSKRIRNHLFDHLEEGRRSSRPGSHTQAPPPFSSEENPRRVVVIGSVATVDDTWPTNKEQVPEVALAGRSNVGKSTLLNALLYGNQVRRFKDGETTDDNLIRKFKRGVTPENVKLPKGVKAKVSDKPGETRKITFFQLGGANSSEQQQEEGKVATVNPQQKLRLVDLPGYGFSFTPQNHDGFQELLLQYLLERGKLLKRVLLLVDARHGLKKADFEFLQTMEDAAWKSAKRKMPAIQVVLTKCDLVSRDDLARRVVHVRQEVADTLRRETSSLPVLLVSARPGVGFNNVRKQGGGHGRARGGVLELQKELAALVPKIAKKGKKEDTAGQETSQRR